MAAQSISHKYIIYNDYDKEGLFYDCPLETLYLGRNLSYDEQKYPYATYYPFYRKERLTSVTIGNNVTNIGYKAFYGCSKITITFAGGTTGWEYASSATATSWTTVSSSNLASWLKNSTYSQYYFKKGTVS